jgi:plexin A
MQGMMLLVVALSLWQVVVVQVAASIVQTFSDETGTERFNHLVVDKNTGLVFIGAVNHLHQLSPDLALVMSEVTGPRDDSPECSARECLPTVLKKPTDNMNKAL